MKNTVRLNFEFPRDEYPYLKLMLAKRGVSLRELANKLLTQEIAEDEESYLNREIERRLEECKNDEPISWEEAKLRAGWTEQLRDPNLSKIRKGHGKNTEKRSGQNRPRNSSTGKKS
jgi:hypothetical protein